MDKQVLKAFVLGAVAWAVLYFALARGRPGPRATMVAMTGVVGVVSAAYSYLIQVSPDRLIWWSLAWGAIFLLAIVVLLVVSRGRPVRR